MKAVVGQRTCTQSACGPRKEMLGWKVSPIPTKAIGCGP
jgi:hypothetical protein